MAAKDKPLDDVLLAMDVVDTLRHRAQLVDQELGAEDRRAELLARLKEIYTAQGIEVPEHILEDGVKALEERRFAYEPPEASLSVKLAKLYVSRGKWGKPVVGGLAALGVGLAGHQAFIVGPQKAEAAAVSRALTETLPAELEAIATTVSSLAVTAYGKGVGDAYYQDGQAALRDEDVDGVRASIASLEVLREDLNAVYDVRVRYKNGAESGFFRTPPNNQTQRNYYLVVEAVDARGIVLTVPISSEEESDNRRVSIWAQRVSREAFEAALEDKGDDAIIQNDRIGHKERGKLLVDFDVATPGGAILEW